MGDSQEFSIEPRTVTDRPKNMFTGHLQLLPLGILNVLRFFHVPAICPLTLTLSAPEKFDPR